MSDKKKHKVMVIEGKKLTPKELDFIKREFKATSKVANHIKRSLGEESNNPFLQNKLFKLAYLIRKAGKE